VAGVSEVSQAQLAVLPGRRRHTQAERDGQDPEIQPGEVPVVAAQFVGVGVETDLGGGRVAATVIKEDALGGVVNVLGAAVFQAALDAGVMAELQVKGGQPLRANRAEKGVNGQQLAGMGRGQEDMVLGGCRGQVKQALQVAAELVPVTQLAAPPNLIEVTFQ